MRAARADVSVCACVRVHVCVSVFVLVLQNGDCFFELFQQLAIILVIKQFVLQFVEVIVPLVKWRLLARSQAKKREKEKQAGHVVREPTQAERESTLNLYESTFDDYNELIIQVRPHASRCPCSCAPRRSAACLTCRCAHDSAAVAASAACSVLCACSSAM